MVGVKNFLLAQTDHTIGCPKKKICAGAYVPNSNEQLFHEPKPRAFLSQAHL